MQRCDPIKRIPIPRCRRPNERAREHEHRVERLIDRLPERLRTTVRWLRRPSSRWVRAPAGLLLVGASLLSILPFFGLWMLPLGLMLLAEDVPPLRRARERLLAWIERRRPPERCSQCRLHYRNATEHPQGGHHEGFSGPREGVRS